MAKSILTPQAISNKALKILSKEMEREQVFSLVEVTLRDGTVLGPIMVGMTPYQLHGTAEHIREGYQIVTFANENESILVHAADILHVKTMRVTSKEK